MHILPAPFFGTVKMKGEGTGFTFPEVEADKDPGQATGTLKSTGALPDHVDYFDPLYLNWYISHDDGASWFGPFASGNECFVTRAAPQCSPKFRTVLYLATNGSTADSESQCVTDTWANFSARNVCAWDATAKTYTRQLKYYENLHEEDPDPDPPYPLITSAPQLLKHGHGQCHAWADLLKECLRANNVANVKRTRITPYTGYRRFAVKHIAFAAGPPYTYPDDDPWFYEENDLTSDPGIPGQNMATPAAKLFDKHFLIHRTGDETYYDPSYGTTTSGPSAFTSDSVDAWENYISGDYHWRQGSSAPAVSVNFADEDF